MIIEEKICSSLREAVEELAAEDFEEAVKSIEYAQRQIQEPQQTLSLALNLIKEAIDIKNTPQEDNPIFRDFAPQIALSKQLVERTLHSGWWKSWA